MLSAVLVLAPVRRQGTMTMEAIEALQRRNRRITKPIPIWLKHLPAIKQVIKTGMCMKLNAAAIELAQAGIT